MRANEIKEHASCVCVSLLDTKSGHNKNNFYKREML